MARAMATRCCWPPDSSPGVCDSQPSRPDGRQGLACELVALGARDAAIDQGQLDVLQRRGAVQEIVALEDETEIVPAQQGPLVAGQFRRPRRPGSDRSPAVGVSRQPRMFIQVDLPEPLGP